MSMSKSSNSISEKERCSQGKLLYYIGSNIPSNKKCSSCGVNLEHWNEHWGDLVLFSSDYDDAYVHPEVTYE